MNIILRKLSFVLLLLTVASALSAQHWNKQPHKGLVFEITNDEAEILITKPHKLKDYQALLHTQVDTFDVRIGWKNKPSRGHFILVSVEDAQLRCQYTCVFPFQVFLLAEYNSMTVQVIDSLGKIRKDAKVKLRRKRIWANPDTKTYRLESAWFRSAERLLRVEMDGFRAFLNVKKFKYNNSWSQDSYQTPPQFYSYMITDKNKYRKGDSVRFKSYALSSSRWPLRKKLSVYLQTPRKSIKISEIKPHRRGSYAGGFVLHDSLNLQLDRNYYLRLETKSGRRVATANFRHEDYELVGDKLSVKLKESQHFAPKANRVFIEATDENGLTLTDAKAEVTVRVLNVSNMYMPFRAFKNQVFHKNLTLSANGDDFVEIPAKWFGKTNLSYEVEVRVTTSENHVLHKRLVANYFFSKYRIDQRFVRDSLNFVFLEKEEEQKNVKAACWVDGVLLKDSISFPTKFKINPNTKSYTFRNKNITQTISLGNWRTELRLEGAFDADSFRVKAINPQNLDLTWHIYRGAELIESGVDTTFQHSSFIDSRYYTYYADVFYTFGGRSQKLTRSFVFKESKLDVDLDIPQRVFPGQEVDATIRVHNAEGIPLRGVDLTALATTRPLNYNLPDLPYYGDWSKARDIPDDFQMDRLKANQRIFPLDYSKWARGFGLDTMLYYQLLFPKKEGFKITYPIMDQTQFAPFIMENGKAHRIYCIELNHKPIYFDWVDKPKEYAFYAKPDTLHQISLRLYDRLILLKGVRFEKGKKTILSFDLNHLPKNSRVYVLHNNTKKTKQPTYISLNYSDRKRYESYIGHYQNYFYEHAYFQQGETFLPLFDFRNGRNATSYSCSFGPIERGQLSFFADSTFSNHFRFEGGFSYKFEDNIVYKLNSRNLVPNSLSRKFDSPHAVLRDLVMSKRRFNAGAMQNKIKPRRWNKRVIDINRNNGRLKVFLPHEKAASGLRALLFYDTEKGTVSRQFEPFSREYWLLETGKKQAIALYNNGSYLRSRSLSVLSNHFHVLHLENNSFHAKDSLSATWLMKFPEYREPYRRAHQRSFYRRNVQINPIVDRSRNSTGNVTGTIRDSNGNLLPGVGVVEKGTSNGTITDFDGRFSLDILSYQTILSISFIGFRTQEVEVSIGTNIETVLQEDQVSLDEVVVVGYGTSRKNASLGSVTRIAARTNTNAANGDDEADKDAAKKKEIEIEFYNSMLHLSGLRRNFNDVGFWKPKLYTNRKGLAKFKVKFPDNITRWDAVVYAMNSRLQTGVARTAIRAYKPLMAELHTPRFLTRGDSAACIGKVSNYTQDSTIVGIVKHKVADKEQKQEVRFSRFRKDLVPTIAHSTDSITVQYSITRDDSFTDGEERKIPVVDQGTIRANGGLSILSRGETKMFSARGNQQVVVELMNAPLDLYERTATDLIEYKYACNEQLASKLMGLLSLESIRQLKGKRFEHKKHIKKIIRRLLKNQNRELLWSWWNKKPESSLWISAHVLKTLKLAKDRGYRVGLPLKEMQRVLSYRFDVQEHAKVNNVKLIDACADWRIELDYESILVFIEKEIAKQERMQIERHKHHPTRYCYCNPYLLEKFQVASIRKKLKLDVDYDSLLVYQQKGILGEILFKDTTLNASPWRSDDLMVNLAAYRFFRNDSNYQHLKGPLQLYLLGLQQKMYFNTYRSAVVLREILPDIITAGYSTKEPSRLSLRGAWNNIVTAFPKKVVLQPNQQMSINHEHGLPVYAMVYTRERVTEAKSGVDGFEIQTMFRGTVDVLQAGKPVELVVEVNVTKENNQKYIMLEVPIPGACSYTDKKQRRRNYNEVHREYHKEKTVIFCKNLPKGRHYFSVGLLPRFTGKFVLNPAQVSLMYFPVVNANTALKWIGVKSQGSGK